MPLPSSAPPKHGSLPGSRDRRVRVLHLIDSLDLGGAQVVLLNLLRYADRTRFAHEAACLHGRGVFWPILQRAGVSPSSLSFHHYFPSYVPRLLWRFWRRRYQVVHCHLVAANVIGKPLAALCGVPVRINHDHCNDKLALAKPWILPADRWANRFATHVIAVSETTRAFVETHEGVPPERTSTIHNGVDSQQFRPQPEARAAARARFGLPEEAFVVGGIGRLTYQKNFALFLEVAAAALARQPNTVFAIAGTGEDEAALRAQAAALGLTQKVRFLGYIAEMSTLYPALDALLLTSRFEGLPITVLEAMAAGVPIIASRLDGIAEVLRHGVEAALVDSGDREGFTAALVSLLEQPALAATYVERALHKVRTSYSAEQMTRQVEALYTRYLP